MVFSFGIVLLCAWEVADKGVLKGEVDSCYFGDWAHEGADGSWVGVRVSEFYLGDGALIGELIGEYAKGGLSWFLLEADVALYSFHDGWGRGIDANIVIMLYRGYYWFFKMMELLWWLVFWGELRVGEITGLGWSEVKIFFEVDILGFRVVGDDEDCVFMTEKGVVELLFDVLRKKVIVDFAVIKF